MPLQMAKPTMAPMLSKPAAAISIDGITAHTQQHIVQTLTNTSVYEICSLQGYAWRLGIHKAIFGTTSAL